MQIDWHNIQEQCEATIRVVLQWLSTANDWYGCCIWFELHRISPVASIMLGEHRYPNPIELN